MNLYRLMVWVAVIEEAGVSAAARRLYLSQPAVSMHLRVLENELGVQLLQRNGRKVEPTEAGNAVYAYAREVLDKTEQLKAQLNRYHQMSGTVSICITKALGQDLIPFLIQSVRSFHPDAEVRVLTASSSEVEEAVHRGEAQIGINLVHDLTSHYRLSHRPLIADDLVLAVPRFHALDGQCLAIEDMQGIPLAWPPDHCVFSRMVKARLGGSQHNLVLSDLESLKAVVKSGDAMAIIPRVALAGDIETDRLGYATFAGEEARIQFHWIWQGDPEVLPPWTQAIGQKMDRLQAKTAVH